MKIIPSSSSLENAAAWFNKTELLIIDTGLKYLDKYWFVLLVHIAGLATSLLLLYLLITWNIPTLALAFNAAAIIFGGPFLLLGFCFLANNWCCFASKSQVHFICISGVTFWVAILIIRHPYILVAMPVILPAVKTFRPWLRSIARKRQISEP